MARISFQGRSFGSAGGSMRDAVNEWVDHADGSLKVAVTAGWQTMYTLTDRVDTGLMKGSVNMGDFERTRTRASGKFGWGIENERKEPYFAYQNRGFWHVWAQRRIPGMHALQGGLVKAKETFRARMRRQ